MIFGYPADAPQMWQVRELFRNLMKGIFYRLNGGVKAACDYGQAKYSGVRGKDLMLVISANVDDSTKFDVKTILDKKEVDRQTVAAASELKDNLYVVVKKDATLVATAGIPFTGGTNGEAVNGSWPRWSPIHSRHCAAHPWMMQSRLYLQSIPDGCATRPA